jgi:hypothetical protein
MAVVTGPVNNGWRRHSRLASAGRHRGSDNIAADTVADGSDHQARRD